MSQDLSHKKAPAPVFVSTAVVIFFLTLSAADSVGFVPYYIDGTSPATESVADASQATTNSRLALATHTD